ncbi:MAG: peptidoglycan DD-metalloendopeptidase family protein [Steroidobacteraceae bacterium]
MSVPAWIGGAALALLLLAGCAGDEVREARSYVVQPQDTLYSIAWRHNLDYRDLARWNHIGPEFRIAVGQSLVLVPPAADNVPRPTATAPAPPQGAREQPRAGRGARPTVAIPHLNWVWPTDRNVAPRPVQSGGILFPGRLGQDVRAAAAGRVVYTGSGIRGYGQLVIIKHNDVLLSAYAYNQEVVVSEGREVAAGETIAHMGAGAHQAAVLYFEIRYDGKPIDPMPFLMGKK